VAGDRDAEFRDPRLVAVYDAEYRWSQADGFFLEFAGAEGPCRVLDLGCGTGRLTVVLADAGHVVTGVDPAGASLDAARARAGGSRVEWVEGTSSSVPPSAFDLAIMTSHVAQVFVEDAAWGAVLDDLHRALAPGGRLVFDSRNPDARAWDRWTPERTRRAVRLPDGEIVTVWTDVIERRQHTVSFTHTYAFGDGEVRTSTSSLRFRSEDELRASLAAAGFAVQDVFGGWSRQPVGRGDDGELLVVARRLAR
jgi:SAM-dependent methyltransferase